MEKPGGFYFLLRPVLRSEMWVCIFMTCPNFLPGGKVSAKAACGQILKRMKQFH
jgi:hypothetical protein